MLETVEMLKSSLLCRKNTDITVEYSIIFSINNDKFSWYYFYTKWNK